MSSAIANDLNASQVSISENQLIYSSSANGIFHLSMIYSNSSKIEQYIAHSHRRIRSSYHPYICMEYG